MNKRIAWGLICSAAVASAALADDRPNSDSAPEDLSGIYACQGKNQSGGGYAGTVAMRRKGEGAYLLLWSIGEQIYQGVAIWEGDLLSSSWTVGILTTGIVVYKVRTVKKLVGRWTDSSGQIGTETLTFLNEEAKSPADDVRDKGTAL